MTADGCIIKVIGTGDLHLDLPNGSKMMKVIFKNAVHSPMMAFTLVNLIYQATKLFSTTKCV